jgi:fructose-1,6-bisphosphatase
MSELWDEDVRALMRRYRWTRRREKADERTQRWFLVADFHRIFSAVACSRIGQRKESARKAGIALPRPIHFAFIVEQAGGKATDGLQAHSRHRSHGLASEESTLTLEQLDIDIAQAMLPE